MKKLLKLLLIFIVAFALVACGTATNNDEPNNGNNNNSPNDNNNNNDGDTGAVGANDLYLITDVGTIDDKSFNQGSWEGLVKYAEEAGVDAHYIQPQEQSDGAYLSAIEEAVTAGAKVVVTPGFLFEPAIKDAAAAHPDVTFILVDAVVEAPNVVSILFAEEQAGFLAGYAAVKEGFTELGFMGGMAVPAVIRFGYGFAAGADYAAAEEGVSVNLKYHYLGEFGPKPEFQTMAASWYNDGVEVIHAAAGGAGNSVMAAAEQAEAWVIGVDVDQKDENDRVLTSAMKGLLVSVYDAVAAVYEGDSFAGTTLVYGVDENGVQISDDFSRFEKFTKEDYDAVYKLLQDDADGIASEIPTNETHENPTDLEFENVTIEYIEN